MRKNFGVKGWLYPQPVMIIAAYDENGVPCAMNAAWGGMCDYNAIIMDIAQSHKTVKNLMAKGEFTVSIADAPHVLQADYVGVVSGNDVPDKLAKASLTVSKAEFVDAPVIEEFPITLECKFRKVTDEGIVGEIVNVSVAQRVLDENGNIDVAKLQVITYDPANHGYYVLGEKVGNAFSDGKQLIK
ncbi:MAG: flavin reductase family protein [Oscillospiraceae bacterium]|nr:flavin reductase family protein [Oscillospiraceae bacterium]